MEVDAERQRLLAADEGAEQWRAWGPYLAERSWGTVREDYGPDGDPWSHFPFEHARSRPYRWVEDGLAGVCDDQQTWCFALALWNGHDPILKERLFGTPTTGPSDEHLRYLDNTPTHSWMRWRYLYPQAGFPYTDSPTTPPGTGDWVVDVGYAKAGPEDLCIRIAVRNAGPTRARIHVLPTLWFRNTWAWEPTQTAPGLYDADSEQPYLRALGNRLIADHHDHGRLLLVGAPAGKGPRALVCDNEANNTLLHGSFARSRYTRDGICDHVVRGEATVNASGIGTKGALWYALTVPAGGRAVLRLRLVRTSTVRGLPDLGEDWAVVFATRRREADEFWHPLGPEARKKLTGLLWSKQFYHFEVDRWLDGDPGAAVSRRRPLNSDWRHLRNQDVVLVPDPWRDPYYTGWDLPFQAIACAIADPAYAKSQLLLLCREWYAHPSGQLPAFEGDFGAVGPPLAAWAALRVYEHDGSRDLGFLARIFAKLLVNFTWWVNCTDGEQSAWTVAYSLDMLEMALILAAEDDAYGDLATKFFEHYAQFKRRVAADGVAAATGLVDLAPYCATLVIPEALLDKLPGLGMRVRAALGPTADVQGDGFDVVGHRLLGVVDRDGLAEVCRRLLDETEFLTGEGLRADGEDRLRYAWNYLIVCALRRYHAAVGDEVRIELPTWSGQFVTLAEAAAEIGRRVIAAAERDEDRPAGSAAIVAAINSAGSGGA